jgi:hypothetical protein
MTVALFGITNDGLNLAVNLLILFLVVLWLALVAWTYFDARRRISDPVLVACATAASLFPFVGTIVYSILRPPEFLADKRERELEIRASELRVRQLEEASCPNCEHPVERNFLRCPNCRARIKDPCESCGKPIDPRWSICPYCETPQRRAVQPERRPPSKRRGKQPAEATSEAPPKSRRTGSRSASGSRQSSGSRSGSRPTAPARAGSSSKASPDPGSGSNAKPAGDGEPERTQPSGARSGRSRGSRGRSSGAPPETSGE